MSTEVKVTSRPPCDVHRHEKDTVVPARYDAKMKAGPWAYLCEACFQEKGLGLGTGFGQRLVVEGEET